MKKTCKECKEEKEVSEFQWCRRDKRYESMCKFCVYVYQILWRSKNTELVRISGFKYSHSEHGRKAIKSKDAAYRATEKGKAVNCKSSSKYYKTEKGKACRARAHAKRRSREFSGINDLTLEQWTNILINQNNMCAICSIGFEETPPQRDHIIPVVDGGSLTKENVQALCKSCNSFKGTRLMKELTK